VCAHRFQMASSLGKSIRDIRKARKTQHQYSCLVIKRVRFFKTLKQIQWARCGNSDLHKIWRIVKKTRGELTLMGIEQPVNSFNKFEIYIWIRFQRPSCHFFFYTCTTLVSSITKSEKKIENHQISIIFVFSVVINIESLIKELYSPCGL